MVRFLIIVFVVACYHSALCQKKAGVPATMVDIAYSGRNLYLTRDWTIGFNNGRAGAKLNYDVECNFMGAFLRNIKSEKHKLYGGIGVNYSEYKIHRLFEDETETSGHFPNRYFFNPDTMDYNLKSVRLNITLCHYTFYKRLVLFQKLGFAHQWYLKKGNSQAMYEEKYGNTYPTTDPAYITPDNPDGWHWVDNYTTIRKNDLGNFKNGFNVFYKFGIGCRFKQFMPFASFETTLFSRTTVPGTFSYFKVQFGLNITLFSKQI